MDKNVSSPRLIEKFELKKLPKNYTKKMNYHNKLCLSVAKELASTFGEMFSFQNLLLI